MIKKVIENRVSRTYLGGGKIDEFYGKEKCEDTFFPEDWTASIVTAYNSTDKNQEGLGICEDGTFIKDYIGDKKFNILVKLLNSSERLVIQAHPTIEYAKEFLNSNYGKTECWYFLDCTDDACVYIGFKEGVKREDWVKAFYNNDSEKMLSMLHKVNIKKGDFIFVDGGVPHSIGAGCFMVELQEPSDLMVVNERFTPSGREIPEQRLHMGLGYEQMFEIYEYRGYSYEELIKKYCPEKKKLSKSVYQILGSELTDKFSMYLLKDGAVFESKKEYKIAIITNGSGRINNVQVKKGDRLFISNEDVLNITGDAKLEIILCE